MRAAALLAALVAAMVIPDAPHGLNVPLVAVLVAAAVVLGSRRSLDLVLFGILALALASMAAVRDAGWIVAVDVVAACVVATFAVAGPRLVAPTAPFRALRAAPALAPTVPEGSASALSGVAVSVVLVVPFGVLFWTADAAFAELGRNVPVPSVAGLPARAFVFGFVLAAALGLALAAKRTFVDAAIPVPRARRLQWAIPLALLDLLFVVFVAVQVTVLFGGHDHVLETSGLTYSEYARQGFWQLIAAAALTVGVVVCARRAAAIERRSEAVLLNVLLGTLCLLTLVTVASAVYRLQLYEDAFGLTRLRLAAETFAWALGVLFVVLLVAGVVRPVRRELVRIGLADAALGLLVFTLSNPDGRIARRNVDHWRDTGRVDVAYLQGLSADAVPALAQLPEPLRSEVLAPFRVELARGEPLTSANYGRRRARAILASAG